jgi:hypothetical protein
VTDYPEALVERVESKEATHRRFYDAFHAWFMQSGCDFWSECDAPEELATLAVEISDAFSRAALDASGLREAVEALERIRCIPNVRGDVYSIARAALARIKGEPHA